MATLTFDYGGVDVPASDHRAAVYLADQRRALRRDIAREREASQVLSRLGFTPYNDWRLGWRGQGEEGQLADPSVADAGRHCVAAPARVAD